MSSNTPPMAHRLPRTVAIAVALLLLAVPQTGELHAAPVPEKGKLTLDRIPQATFQLDGFVGGRVKADVDNWLIVAPKNNPGLLDMFARRDAGGEPDLMPWAGEFVGKYLISGVQAMAMSRDPKLKETLQHVVKRLVELQADDGYLGPWPKNERLRGHWDLWGHYHVMLGLMLWSEETGDARAAAAARRIAEAVCNTCLDTPFRVKDAGSPEMNMGIIHGLGRIYRTQGDPRHLRMAQEVLKDFETAGDYYRTGLAGEEFYRTPRPRWESLHSLQGLVELFRVTGDETFRAAFLHHWASIRRFDFRNTGGFSSGEQATGDPYVNNAIETCCVVAWQAVMIDALRLTGEPTIADDLESSTLNAMLGAQHPSGAWCTYNTPMDGQRIPSHIDIRFQAKPDTPHLNCCSVNGPRGYGSISQWGVMRSDRGLVVNYYGPMEASASLADGTPVRIRQQTDYPAGGNVTMTVEPAQAKPFTLALRIPAWSEKTRVSVGGEVVAATQGGESAIRGEVTSGSGDAIDAAKIGTVPLRPGTYLELARTWKPGDRVVLELDVGPRYEPGDLEQSGKASLYWGPILLALDSRFHPGNPPTIDVAKLSEARLVPIDDEIARTAGAYKPWLVVDVPTADGGTARLIDFASAGATTLEGKPLSSYVSWLPATNMRPPRPVAWRPADRAKVAPGKIAFAWRRPAAATRRHAIVISDDLSFKAPVINYGDAAGAWLVLPEAEVAKLQPGAPYYWKVVARNEHGEAESLGPWKQFTVDPNVPPTEFNWPYGQRDSDMMVTEAPLHGDVKPSHGTLLEAAGWKPAPGPDGSPGTAVETDGETGIVKYSLPAFPEEDYSVSIWVSVSRLPKTHYGQVFSAWSAAMDDPLRLVVEGGKLFARIEAGGGFGTEGVEIQPGKWHHLAAVKQGPKLTLYVDARALASAAVPARVSSGAGCFALGGNPKFAGPEFLAARLSGLRFYARALSEREVKQEFASAAEKR
ncbi:MAG: glycoside hydrolase family 127 protein [Planctomycetia bacterium]|nr:glycoside hydrolase family 127 protein [Planctomycetia bacterium]